MRIHCLVLTMAVMVISGKRVSSAPVIGSISGHLAHGSEVTVLGSGFGDYSVSPGPCIHDDLEDGFDSRWGGAIGDLSINTANQRHPYALQDASLNFRAGNDDGNFGGPGTLTDVVAPEWYVSYWVFFDDNFDFGTTDYGSDLDRFLSNVKIVRYWSPESISENLFVSFLHRTPT